LILCGTDYPLTFDFVMMRPNRAENLVTRDGLKEVSNVRSAGDRNLIDRE